MGGSDSSLYIGQLAYTLIIVDPLLNPLGFWAFKMKGVFVDGSSTNLCSGKCLAVADTGSSLIIAPRSQNLTQFFSKIGADPDGIIKCDNSILQLPSLDIFYFNSLFCRLFKILKFLNRIL